MYVKGFYNSDKLDISVCKMGIVYAMAQLWSAYTYYKIMS